MIPSRLSGAYFFRIFQLKYVHYIISVVAVACTALLCIPLADSQNYHVVSFILLFVVSILSTFISLGPVLLASTLSALVWNFFFIPPHHTFNIAKTEDLLIFGLFFIIALTGGVLTTRLRRQEHLAREREKRTEALFQLTRELSKAVGIKEVLAVSEREIMNHFALEAFFILQDGNNQLIHNDPLNPEKTIDKHEYTLAEWVFLNSELKGSNNPNSLSQEYTFFPLGGTRLNPGVLAVKQKKAFAREQLSYWETFIAQISNALEREFLGEMAQKVRFLDESDRLYKTLFNSISHELRIPVATIMGASDTIVNSVSTGSTQAALCQEIFTASLRLNRLIENLLNMSRLESGHISVRLDWYDIQDLINKVAENLAEELKPFTLNVSIPDTMPLVKIDFGLMEQVLYNLLYNSSQYAPAASVIELSTAYQKGEMLIMLRDEGPGFPEAELKNVFKKFFRLSGGKTGGLGLGLSIVKGFVEAHNGKIKVENTRQGGAKFTLRIPSEVPEISNIQL